jgi:hypothetical protein
LVSIYLTKYVVFECLACNLLQISPLKLCFEKLRFSFKMCSQNAGNAISETQILKIYRGGMPPDPLKLTRACGTRLTPSAIAYYPAKEKMGPLAVLPHR